MGMGPGGGPMGVVGSAGGGTYPMGIGPGGGPCGVVGSWNYKNIYSSNNRFLSIIIVFVVIIKTNKQGTLYRRVEREVTRLEE